MRKRRLIISLILTVIFFVVLTITVGRSLFGIGLGEEKGEWERTIHEQYDFSLLHPTSWRGSKHGEQGFKGDERIKLRMYRSLMDGPFVTVRYREANSPSLEDVVDWSREWIDFYEGTNNSSKDDYEQILLEEDVLDGKEIIKRRYTLGATLFEEVYIARDDDMITIRFQAGIEQFDNYEEAFETILESFGPLE